MKLLEERENTDSKKRLQFSNASSLQNSDDVFGEYENAVQGMMIGFC